MTTETKTAEQLAAEIKASHAKALDETKEIGLKAMHEAEKSGKLAGETREKVDELLTKSGELTSQLAAIEQKLVEVKNFGAAQEYKSVGQAFIEDFERSKAEVVDSKRSFYKSVDGVLTTARTTDLGSIGAGIATTTLPDIQRLPQLPFTIRDLLGKGRMSGNSIEIVREEEFVDNADMAPENTPKPKSTMRLTSETINAKVIAHYTVATRQALDDLPQLASMIDVKLINGLKKKEERQLLSGNGIGENIKGIIPQATQFDETLTSATDNLMDRLRIASLQITLSDMDADAQVINHFDWERIVSLKDTTGNYIFGNPQSGAQQYLWGRPVVLTQGIAKGNFLVGSFATGAQIFDRWDASVKLYDQNGEDPIHNRFTILAEQRLAFAVYNRAAFVYGSLG